MNGTVERKRRTKQHGTTHVSKVDNALRMISESLDRICAERLTPQLVPMAKHVAAHGQLHIFAELPHQQECISVSTVRRRLRTFAHLQQRQLPRRHGPEQVSALTRDVPMKRIPWPQEDPGHFKVD